MDSVGGEHEVISGKRRPSRKGGATDGDGWRRQLHRWHSDGDGSYIRQLSADPVQRPGRTWQLLHLIILHRQEVEERHEIQNEARHIRFARPMIEARLTGSRNYTTCMFDICDLFDLLLSGLAGPAG